MNWLDINEILFRPLYSHSSKPINVLNISSTASIFNPSRTCARQSFNMDELFKHFQYTSELILDQLQVEHLIHVALGKCFRHCGFLSMQYSVYSTAY